MIDPKQIQHLDYVVQRNWQGEAEHDDLDLFVSLEDVDEMLAIVDGDPLIDVRFPGDGYYPVAIERHLLTEPDECNGWKIPNPFAHFISLYYHNAVHKKDNPYGEKLKTLFLEVFPPVRPDDKGVGYFV